jgi:hypothetical protein
LVAASWASDKSNNREKFMRKLMLGLAAAGTLGLAATGTPASAGVFTGLQMPDVESNMVDVQRRCHHHRWSSRWHCHRWHRRWHSRHHWHGPRFYGPGFYGPRPFYW